MCHASVFLPVTSLCDLMRGGIDSTYLNDIRYAPLSKLYQPEGTASNVCSPAPCPGVLMCNGFGSIRILYMPLIYAVISFFSYRFFRDYTYYSLIEVAYEVRYRPTSSPPPQCLQVCAQAVTLSAFLLLLIEFVASTSQEHKAEAAIARKDKRPLPLPVSPFPVFLFHTPVFAPQREQYEFKRTNVPPPSAFSLPSLDKINLTHP